VHDFIRELCTQQAEVILNHENENLSPHRARESQTEIVRGLDVVVIELTEVQMMKLSLQLALYIYTGCFTTLGHNCRR